jgi:hypothetical protein
MGGLFDCRQRAIGRVSLNNDMLKICMGLCGNTCEGLPDSGLRVVNGGDNGDLQLRILILWLLAHDYTRPRNA